MATLLFLSEFEVNADADVSDDMMDEMSDDIDDALDNLRSLLLVKYPQAKLDIRIAV